jgi:hypothetical protein
LAADGIQQSYVARTPATRSCCASSSRTTDPQRYERPALRWLEQFINELLPPLTEVALAASALAELRHGNRNTGDETLKRLLRHG